MGWKGWVLGLFDVHGREADGKSIGREGEGGF